MVEILGILQKIYNKGPEEQMGRRSYDKNFKAKAALETLHEKSTLQELGRKCY